MKSYDFCHASVLQNEAFKNMSECRRQFVSNGVDNHLLCCRGQVLLTSWLNVHNRWLLLGTLLLFQKLIYFPHGVEGVLFSPLLTWMLQWYKTSNQQTQKGMFMFTSTSEQNKEIVGHGVLWRDDYLWIACWHLDFAGCGSVVIGFTVQALLFWFANFFCESFWTQICYAHYIVCTTFTSWNWMIKKLIFLMLFANVCLFYETKIFFFLSGISSFHCLETAFPISL